MKALSIDELFEVNSSKFNLTEREMQIALYWIKDFSYQEIGRLLGISPNTVRSHLSRINIKLQVNSKASLILKIIGMD
ncbi:helix-turn-helix transcriptional regulator [Paenibacillus dokdonensis]|uniref:helix-turn-helix transcriptional regulator n=1 Tax=Paenibacillus dokdonensis TaxID=2567944 RepID=UPI001FE8FCD9|nr:helix-turn-helix transcriptional regulator [Paenibacillus dokdonensis]